MKITFDKEYLKDLYVTGSSSDKKHRFQPDVVRRYIKTVDLMITGLTCQKVQQVICQF